MPSDPTQTTGWALFRDGKQVSKIHSTERAVEIEAYERGGVICMPRGIVDRPVLLSRYEIKRVEGLAHD